MDILGKEFSLKVPVIVLLVVSLLSGCDYEFGLMGGYRLYRLNGDELTIQCPGGSNTEKSPHDGPAGIVFHNDGLAGNVRKFGVNPPYIAGYVTSYYGDTDPARQRYFVLNTSTHKIKEGLTEEQWKSELKTIGWADPILFMPGLEHALSWLILLSMLILPAYLYGRWSQSTKINKDSNSEGT
jgi:hypothetical protein